VLEGSPVELLECRSGAALAPGKLGLILAPPGLGKTTLLVQFGLAEMLAARPVLHVSQGESVAEVRGRYKSVFGDYRRRGRLKTPARSLVGFQHQQMVHSYAPGEFSVEKLTNLLSILAENADFRPETILLDGVIAQSFSRAQMGACRALAWAHGVTLWMTGLSNPAVAQLGPEQLPPPFGPMVSLIDRILELHARGAQVEMRVRKGEGEGAGGEPILLDPSYMRSVDDGIGALGQRSGLPGSYTLYSGAAAGSEAYFGEMAERYGLAEVNFSYPGHEPVRDRGLRVLSERQLRQGDVSLAYASRRLGRDLKLSHSFRRVLQSLWHQVHGVDQVLVVGEIRKDGTLTGGTGWGGELARLWKKPLWVFDQELHCWLRWNGAENCWTQSDVPKISSTRFCGTGTRKLNDAGRAAIEAVFAVSFPGSAPPPA